MKLTIAVSCWTLVSRVATASLPAQTPHEVARDLPSEWTLHSRASDNQLVSLQIALTHPHHDYLDVAQGVSDPTSPDYGKHLDREQLASLLPDFGSAAKQVSAWLSMSGVPNVTHEGDWLYFTTSVGVARDLLSADFKYYKHDFAPPVLRTLEYSVPRHLKDTIDFVYPTVHFMTPSTHHSRKSSLVSRQHIPVGPVTCATSVCPKNLTREYNVTYVPPDNKSGSQLGIAGFLEQWPSQNDTRQFLQDYGLRNRTAPYPYIPALVNGGLDPDDPTKVGAEAVLDVEYGMAIADPLPVTYFSTGGRPPQLSQPGNKVVPANESGNEPYIALFRHVLNMSSPPQVLSISYADDEWTVPLPFARKACSLAAQLAARGVSVVVSTGDSGAAGNGEGACLAPDGSRRFVPTFPASCPWVTAVGATNAYGVAHFSGGGFSNYFPRPAWQRAAVKGYLGALNGSHAGWYNASGRAVPDLSLFGSAYLTVGGGFAYQQKGTSASTPVFAAMVALLNDRRLRQGKPVLGFLNPMLYKNKAAWRDVIEGGTDGCQVDDGVEVGWQALKGWDAASGLGEPNFRKLMKLLG